MDRPDLSVGLGRVSLKNPLICGSGEHTLTGEGIAAALEAGAAAVVAKSINESQAAKDQLLRADYRLYDSRWQQLAWDFSPPPDATLFCRSGLAQQNFDQWLEMVAALDAEAAEKGSYVIASLIPSASDETLDYARRIEAAGVRILEVNVGAPHGEEAAAGSIADNAEATHVRATTRRFREAVSMPLWVKLTGRSNAIDTLVLAAREGGADAVTVMGRFMAFLPDIETMAPALSTRAAIGGGWALPLACDWIQKARRTAGAGFALIGTNGARSGLDIARFMLAGASAVQMTTAILTGGYGVIGAALTELRAYLESKGMDAADLIGLAADRLESYQDQPTTAGRWREIIPQDGGQDLG